MKDEGLVSKLKVKLLFSRRLKQFALTNPDPIFTTDLHATDYVYQIW